MLARELQNSLFLAVLSPHLISFTYSAAFQLGLSNLLDICLTLFLTSLPRVLSLLFTSADLPLKNSLVLPQKKPVLSLTLQSSCPPLRWVLLIAWDFDFA